MWSGWPAWRSRSVAPMRGRPGTAAVVDASVAQQQLRDAVAQAGEIGADLLACAGEITSRLRLGRRDRDRSERPGEQQPHQQLCILAVGLDSIGSRARRLRR